MSVTNKRGETIEEGDTVKRHHNLGSGVVVGFSEGGRRVLVRWPTGRVSPINPNVLYIIKKRASDEETARP